MFATTTGDQLRERSDRINRAGSVALRLQTAIGRGVPAGSSRDERLDPFSLNPFSLPLRFEARDAAADGSVRFVELTRERVVLRRSVLGMLMAVNLPVASYLGVALRIEPPVGDAESAVTLMLEHRDRALSLPLYRADDSTDVVAEWQSWARALKLPLLVAEADGRLREPFERVGSLRVGAPRPRRRKHSTLKRRRPSIFLRRKPGRRLDAAPVHRGEREIIARN
jgi:hypothetical protein